MPQEIEASTITELRRIMRSIDVMAEKEILDFDFELYAVLYQSNMKIRQVLAKNGYLKAGVIVVPEETE